MPLRIMNVGKRNLNLNRAAIGAARNIQRLDSNAARCVASDALRELESDTVRSRLRR